MQYYDPGEDRFVGDCMPFWHDGVYHLYYLLDEGHHQALGGLGGHQWAHASTSDLVHWTHHPLAIPITHRWEGSICTGSVIHHDGITYAFYATRMRDRTQHLAMATSRDGVRYVKQAPNPLASPPAGYSPYHYRDPFVWRDEATGVFHMLVTAEQEVSDPPGRGGCLVHLVSNDLRTWAWREPFLVPGDDRVPECPDHFTWNGWSYLVFSTHGFARYRMARSPFGPWETPAVEAFEGPLAAVIKTAPYGENRRIGVAFLPTRADDRDDGARQYGGSALFREIIQHPNGTLGTCFPPEMVPSRGEPVALTAHRLTPGATMQGCTIRLEASTGQESVVLGGVPFDAHIEMQVVPSGAGGAFGLRLSAPSGPESGVALAFDPEGQRVALGSESIEGVEGLDRPFGLEIICTGDIIDVCITGRRCLVNRVPERGAGDLGFVSQGARVSFANVIVRPLLV